MGTWEYGRFRWKLWKLQRHERRAEKQYRRLIARAQKRGDQQEVGGLESEESHTAIEFQVDIRKLHSEYLIREAARLIVPLPELGDENGNGMWDRDKGQLFLSDRGINKVRVDLRAERKARVELFLMWVPGIVGILGTLIGLVSVLAARK
jgi:hypothetical protein